MVRISKRLVIAACMLAANLSLSAAPQAFAEYAGKNGIENAEPAFDLGCAQRDLDLITLIERNGNSGLSATGTLVEASNIMHTARAACAFGDVDNAHALYDMALRRLANPSDLARR